MSLNFDGVNDYVDCRAGGAVVNWVNNAAAASMSLWIVCDVSVRQEVLMGCSVNNGGVATNNSRMAFEKEPAGNLLGIGQAGDGTALQSGTAIGAVPAGVHFNIVNRFNVAADEICIYQSGALNDCDAVAFPGAAFTNSGSASATFGADEVGSPLNFDGRMEDGRIYARLLSDAEISTIEACRGHDGIVLSISGRYRMNDGAPGVAATLAGSVKDISNNQRHANPVNSPTWAETPLSFRRRYL